MFFGKPGASHLHDFLGNTDTDAFSDTGSLQAGATTCVMPDDTSAYWVPATYENGVRLTPSATSKNILLYYRRGGLGSGVIIQPFPPGLKMVLGNAQALSVSQNPAIGAGKIYWKCGPGSNTHLPAPPTSCPGTTTMSLVFIFPQCWDGVNLDSANHLSHMANTSGSRCPASHPVPLPRITAYLRYTTGSTVGTITYASGPYYTAHMDVFNAWDEAALQSLVANCLNAGVDCGVNPDVP